MSNSTSIETGINLPEPRKKDVVICSLLMLSFCYELPLVEITQYDRLNPRLFDVILLIALFGASWKRNKLNSILKVWELLTAIFVSVSIISFIVLLPKEYGNFSLFYAAKYIETLLALYVLTGFNWRNSHIEQLFKYFCYGMIFAGIWGGLQHLGVLESDRYLPNGELIPATPGSIRATFGPTYFHSGMMGAMGAGIAIALFQRKTISTMLFMAAFTACAFLAIFAGTRAGLAALIIICAIILTKNAKSIVTASVIIIALTSAGVVNYITTKSLTATRIIEESSVSHNRIKDRIQADWLHSVGALLDYHGVKIILVGGGFYAVPMPDNNDQPRYRVGYGLHNIHVFTLEQGGIMAFIVAFIFWWKVLSIGWKKRNQIFARSGFAIGIAIFLLGWGGQIFYHGFGTENMVTFQVVTLILLLTMTNQNTSVARSKDKRAIFKPKFSKVRN